MYMLLYFIDVIIYSALSINVMFYEFLISIKEWFSIIFYYFLLRSSEGLMNARWPLHVAGGGVLLVATCSILSLNMDNN